ncbi:hypothetical protein H0H92_015021, partial [Tricholoma furcatifolium]
MDREDSIYLVYDSHGTAAHIAINPTIEITTDYLYHHYNPSRLGLGPHYIGASIVRPISHEETLESSMKILNLELDEERDKQVQRVARSNALESLRKQKDLTDAENERLRSRVQLLERQLTQNRADAPRYNLNNTAHHP